MITSVSVNSEDAPVYATDAANFSNLRSHAPRPAYVDQALKWLADQCRPGQHMSDPSVVRDYLRLHLGTAEREVFGMMLLDSHHRTIGFYDMFFGTLGQTSVHPREVVKLALSRNAAAVILYHNHPSGATDPSRADEGITQTLKNALGLIDVRVLDHFIVSSQGTTSFAERGLI